ncbi:hypothetical protein AMST5_00084 [freshwater sediment metagenome]|uniref:ABC transporter domain-containing protein n=1 Tax=freshwater sediment metagenome TaxID=556182 RepID=A0AA48LZQ9_9ZZZZ
MSVLPASIVLESISIEIEGKKILSEISFSLTSGRRACMMGPSGSGKSTLLKSVAGLIKPTKGFIGTIGNIGYLPQDSRDIIPPWRTVDKLITPETARLLGLVAQMSQFPNSLSGGQLRRLAIGFVFSRSKSIYLLDEPFNGLDIDLRERCVSFISAAVKRLGSTLLFISHYEEDARSLEVNHMLRLTDNKLSDEYKFSVASRAEATNNA